MSSKAAFCPHFSQRSRGGLGDRFGSVGVSCCLVEPSPSHSFQDGVMSSRNNGSQPAKAEIARERTLASIRRKNKTRGNCDAKNIIIHDRIQQYPGEELSIKDGKLFVWHAAK